MSWDQVWIDINIATMDPSMNEAYGEIGRAHV